MNILLIAVAAVNSAPANPLTSYLFCATEKAVSLIPSGEPATTIAEVAQQSCEALIAAAADWDEEQSHADPVIARFEARYGRQSFDRAELLNRLRTAARQAATSAVVEIKAKAAVRE